MPQFNMNKTDQPHQLRRPARPTSGPNWTTTRSVAGSRGRDEVSKLFHCKRPSSSTERRLLQLGPQMEGAAEGRAPVEPPAPDDKRLALFCCGARSRLLAAASSSSRAPAQEGRRRIWRQIPRTHGRAPNECARNNNDGDVMEREKARSRRGASDDYHHSGATRGANDSNGRLDVGEWTRPWPTSNRGGGGGGGGGGGDDDVLERNNCTSLDVGLASGAELDENKVPPRTCARGTISKAAAWQAAIDRNACAEMQLDTEGSSSQWQRRRRRRRRRCERNWRRAGERGAENESGNEAARAREPHNGATSLAPARQQTVSSPSPVARLRHSTKKGTIKSGTNNNEETMAAELASTATTRATGSRQTGGGGGGGGGASHSTESAGIVEQTLPQAAGPYFALACHMINYQKQPVGASDTSSSGRLNDKRARASDRRPKLETIGRRAKRAPLSGAKQTLAGRGTNCATKSHHHHHHGGSGERARRNSSVTGGGGPLGATKRALLFLLVLAPVAAAVTAALGHSDAELQQQQQPPPPPPTPPQNHKLELWRSLLAPLYATPTRSSGPHRPGPGEWGPIELLAERLARWPDQRRAALFYVEQLGRQLEGQAPREGPVCRQISWAQLIEPAAGAARRPREPESILRQVALDQLGPSAWSPGDANEAARLQAEPWRQLERLKAGAVVGHSQAESEPNLAAHLNRHAHASRAARLALDNANLISRLLLIRGDDDDTDDDSDEQPHQAHQADSSGGAEGGRAQESRSSLGFFRSLFGAFQQPKASAAAAAAAAAPTTQAEHEQTTSEGAKRISDTDELLKEAENLDLLLHRLVTPKFLRYLLERKLRDHLQQSRAGAGQLVHSIGAILMEEQDRSGTKEASRNRRQADSAASEAIERARVSFAAAAVNEELGAPDEPTGGARNAPIKFVDLLKSNTSQPVARLPFERVPSFLARWILANRFGELAKLSRRLASWRANRLEMEDGHQLELEDGEWFSPLFQCPFGARWLLTYSAPFFAHSANGSIRFRGVSFVSLNLAKSGQLISQCASKEVSFLGDTNQCHKRLTGSQCIPLPDQQHSGAIAEQLRPGGYVCQCAAAWPHSDSASKRAISRRRKQLIELIQRTANESRLGSGRQLDLHEADLGFIRFGSTNVEAAAGANNDDDDDGAAAAAATTDGDIDAAAHQLEVGRPSFNDKRRVALALAAAANSRASRNASAIGGRLPFFLLGAQLESDAALEWLAGGQVDSNSNSNNDNNNNNNDDDDDYNYSSAWPSQACQLCRELPLSRPPPPPPPPPSSSSSPSSPSPIPSGASKLRPSQLECESGASDESAGWRAANYQPLAWARPLVLTLQSVCLVITVCLICVILRIRKSRLIVVSGWLMLETMLIGAILLHTSILVRYFQPTSLTCLLEPWFRELGFSVFYGSILIKLYRILTEFQTRKAHRVCLRDKDQIVYLLAIVFIVIGYMSAWTALMVDGFFASSEPFGAPRLEPNSLASFAPPNEPPPPPPPTPPPSLPSEDSPQPPNSTVAPSTRPKLSDALEGFVFAALSGSQVSQIQGARSEHRKRRLSGLQADSQLGGDETELELTTLEPERFQEAATIYATTRSPAGGRRTLAKARARSRSQRATMRRPDRLATRPTLNAQPPVGVGGSNANKGTNSTREARLAPAYQEDAQNDDERYGEQLEPLELRQTASQLKAGPNQAGLVGEPVGNSFGELFSGLLESEHHYERKGDTLVYLIRCRKLTWDYVTESSEIALLLFGVHLVYKLRNASIEVHNEKLIMSVAIFIELLISSCVYLVRHSMWHQLTSDHLLILYAIRCQLTVTLTVALVFWPKLWQIGRNKPSLLFGALFNYSFRHYNDHAATNCGSTGASSTGANTGATGASAQASGQRGNSMRHRCHISCEVHDHHLGDASRLQQAMLSNSALEIGSISLADMDPDEIQAELKRVYTQLEMLKTKVMRRDNPHISKRRGGRKPGHRKFSLQAFHNRHSSSGEHQHSSSASTTAAGTQSESAGAQTTSDQVSLLATSRQAQQSGFGSTNNQYLPSSLASGSAAASGRLPALAEHEGENSSSCAGPSSSRTLHDKRGSTVIGPNSGTKHVRVDDKVLEFADASNKQARKPDERHRPETSNNHFKVRSLTSKLMGKATGKQANCRTGSTTSKWTHEPPSTSSLGLDDDTIMAMNDSQSSGEVTPQHRSSVVYGNSSYHTDELSSVN